MKRKHMKQLLIFILNLFTISNSFAVNITPTININKEWKFIRLKDSEIGTNFEKTNFNDASWQSVSLPHTAKLEPLLVNNQWQGICWYRRTITPSSKNKNKKFFLEFEGAMNYSKIYINGKLVTEHQGGFLPIVIDATKYFECGKKNVVAVRLDNTDNIVTGPKPLNRLDFNMYGGLYRKVNFSIKENVYISNPNFVDKVAGGGIFITFPKVTDSEATVNIKTHVVNDHKKEQSVTLINELYFKESLLETKAIKNSILIPGKDKEFNTEFKINTPKLWSPDFPSLYILKTKVVVGGIVKDEKVTRFGIREFTFNNNKELFINGKKTFLRGVNRHQEYPFIGYALSDNAQYRDAKKIKDAGFDYIRLSHYPQSPAFMDACDELGIVVIDAIMGWQYYGDNVPFREYCYSSARQLIRRDRNRPSVLAWEVSLNETQMPLFFMKKLNEIVHEEYPGENVYSCGWMPEEYDIYLQARQHRIRHHFNLDVIKQKPYSVSEYGDWEYHSTNPGFNQDKVKPSKESKRLTSSRQFRAYGETRLLTQAKNIQESHNDNLNTPAYSDSYWVMYDYNRGYHHNIEASGLSDIFRIPKFGYYFYKSQRNASKGNVIKIASYWNKKSPTNVKIYSNAEKVKLYLNEVLIAEQSPDTDAMSNNLTHPPFTFNIGKFEPGTLRAVASINGENVATDIVKTPLAPKKLKIWIDESGKKPQAGVNDVVFAYIAVIDKNGTINPDYDFGIGVKVKGNAEIINLDSIKAEAGIATVLLKIGESTDNKTITLNAVSDNMYGKLSFNID